MLETSHKIALFLPVLVGGGAERVMVNLADELAKLGRNVDFVLAKADGPYLHQVPPAVNIVDLHTGRTRNSLPGLIDYLNKTRPRALISGLDNVNVLAVLANKLARSSTKSIITLHNTYSEKIKHQTVFSLGWFTRQMMTWLYPKADEIVAVSQGVADDYRKTIGLPAERIKVIYNPVINATLYAKAEEALSHPWFAPEAPPVVLSAGRLTEQKNYAALIRAVARVKDKCPVRLMILGEGELRGELEALVATLGLQELVSLPGFVKNPYQYMARAGVFALSSRWEGLPTVLIEAMALGIPVVSSNCRSGPEEILQAGRLGWLVPVDDIEGLAAAIAEALTARTPRYRSEDLQCYHFDFAAKQYLQLVEGP